MIHNSTKFEGIPASSTVAIGKIKIYRHGAATKRGDRIVRKSNEESKRFKNATFMAKHQIKQLRKKVQKEFGEDNAKVFDAHLLILDDPSFISKVEDRIKNGEAAEHAVRAVLNEIVKEFTSIKSGYIRERVADLKDVGTRIINNLIGTNFSPINLDDKRVIVAKELFPSDTVMMPKDKILAFVTEKGGKTSHVSIIARTLGIPCVVGIEGISEMARDGDTIIVDGDTGTVILHPTQKEFSIYEDKVKRHLLHMKNLEKANHEPAITKDGRRIKVVANVGNAEEVDSALEAGAEGIGLLRTEFLFLGRKTPPTEDEIVDVLRDIGKRMIEKPVVVRTLDIGGDKPPSYIEFPKENNPFLGMRGIRFCLKSARKLFKTQLRAILKARKYCNVKIMFPMISTIKEVKETKKILREVAREIGVSDKELSKIELGIMIEIPSAALMSDQLAEEVDFFSIGTNDLTQYTLAADRTNENISELYDHLHPSVIRLIEHTVKSAHEKGKWVGICGELASVLDAIPLLVSIGIDELSVAYSKIPEVKSTIRKLSTKDARKLASKFRY